jgi:hypothetical protein
MRQLEAGSAASSTQVCSAQLVATATPCICCVRDSLIRYVFTKGRLPLIVRSVAPLELVLSVSRIVLTLGLAWLRLASHRAAVLGLEALLRVRRCGLFARPRVGVGWVGSGPVFGDRCLEERRQLCSFGSQGSSALLIRLTSWSPGSSERLCRRSASYRVLWGL